MFIIAIVAVAMIVLVFNVDESYGSFTPVLPVYIEDDVPTIAEFKKMNQNLLLKNHAPHSTLRDNGEKIETYFFYEKSKGIRIITYVEDSTDEQLKNYIPFTTDHLLTYLQVNENEIYFIYAERNGNACLFPLEKLNDFWTGVYSGCSGGAVEVKETDEGFAIYTKFFDEYYTSTKDFQYPFYFDYYDITKTSDDGLLEEYQTYHFPDIQTIGTAIPIPISDQKSKKIQVNSGKINVNDFLYKPFDIMTEDLKRNSFECADDTISLVSNKQFYDIEDVVRIDVKINSWSNEDRLKLKVYDENEEIVFENFSTVSKKGESLFLIDLDDNSGADKFHKGLYRAEVEYGIDGSKKSTYFAIGDMQIPESFDTCYFYLTFDAYSNSASVLIHVSDSSNSGRDQVQIFVDKKGDSENKLDENDVSFSINTKNIGAHEYTSDGSWITHAKHNPDGRLLLNNYGYDVLFHIKDVGKDFKFAIEQIDNTGMEGAFLKSTQIPSNAFSTHPEFWYEVEIIDEKISPITADVYQPDEIVVTQLLDVNLILVGDTWDSEIKDMITKNLNLEYSPYIALELNRAGITYHYDYNFVDVSENDSNDLFEYMKSESKPWRGTFYGENTETVYEYWGFAPWIKANHTEWMTNTDRFKIDFKTMDASKMEEYLQQNIISRNNVFTKSSAVNLVFISGDMDDIDFLHSYDLRTRDVATKEDHEAVGMMGFGGKYNFYFFDLYSVPWHDIQGFPDSDPTDDWGFYDKTWDNDMINLHDIHTDKRHAQLISDYTNNATSFIITPSYLYEPIYKSKYVADIVLVSMGSDASIPSLTDKFFNAEKIKRELEKLTPFSEWEIKFSVQDISDGNFPTSLRNAINEQEEIAIYSGYPEYGTTHVVSSDKIKKAVIEWASSQQTGGINDYKDVEDSIWTIPVILIIDDKQNYLWIEEDGVLGPGIAPSHPDDPTQPCCALGVMTDWEIWNDKQSATDLVLHEIGHTMSFMHPFMGFTDEGEFATQDYFEKWYWGVMGFNQPIQGCGYWYDWAVDEKLIPDDSTCGIADTFFTEFDRDNYSRGITVNLIKTAKINIYNSMIELERDGKDLNNLSKETKNTVSEINSLLNKAESKLKGNDLNSPDGSIKNALDAAILSSQFAEKSNVSYEVQDKSKIKLDIPPWIKSNAKWWSNDAITTSEFLTAIEFLINQRILIIPDTIPSQSESMTSEVPSWVKNNASWWANDVISDSDFVSAIQYLISQGIIQIDPSEVNTTTIIVE
ncbi:hypothetical protein NMSP_0823 [Candidatus Nitrosomarinus catalina]|uniref:Uncharacterized protein n=1 Tax=Candidatus Nitrosomarinus catalinensis TaxID=1898749 RepID=A0A2Z2HKA2_9ARCH|nr:hypothetical protein [Candidatus Nitrosomarinus catalina]ARS64443.1 hypothetical protein NMSP_0823 [Candidatus Nitrosomarinus catalina]